VFSRRRKDAPAAERAPRAGDDHRADRVVGVTLARTCDHLVHHLLGEGVSFSGRSSVSVRSRESTADGTVQ